MLDSATFALVYDVCEHMDRHIEQAQVQAQTKAFQQKKQLFFFYFIRQRHWVSMFDVDEVFRIGEVRLVYFHDLFIWYKVSKHVFFKVAKQQHD